MSVHNVHFQNYWVYGTNSLICIFFYFKGNILYEQWIWKDIQFLTLYSTQAPLDAFEMWDFFNIIKKRNIFSKWSIFHNIFKIIEM